MARAVIARVLDARQLDDRYSDIREFFALLPLALFEVADLAARLDMPETTTLLLECDLTCTGPDVGIAAISPDARALLRTTYQALGNQPAAQLLDSVGSIGDVMRRCRDTADWRTLLLYQEAADGLAAADDGPAIGDTLVSLGLLNSIRPGDSSQAGYAASWRLARWDVPALPLVRAAEPRFIAPIGHQEESLYSIFKLRARGQLRDAACAAQAHLAVQPRASWATHAVAMLLPLIAGGADGALGRQGFVHASRAAALVLARGAGTLGPEAMDSIHQASLALHETAVRRAASAAAAAAAPGCGRPLAEPVFARYREAARAACAASRRARNWQASMNHIFRLRATMRATGLGDRALRRELGLWEAETLWDAGSRGLAIEMLQSQKAEIERALHSQGANSSGSSNEDNDPWAPHEVEAATVLLSRVILTVGEWSDQQRSERPVTLWEEYFNKSARLLENVQSQTAWTGRVLHGLAAFAERQCEDLTATRDDEATIAMRRQKSQELVACQRELSKAATATESGRLAAILRRLEIQVANDQKELAALRASIDGFLRLAIWSFVKCLGCTDAFDDSVYSLVALVVTHARSAELQDVLQPTITDDIPSRKFLPLVHQLCARLSTDEDNFHRAVVRLVRRMAVDYPYHTMYHLFALRNANHIPSPATLRRRTGSMAAMQPPESERMEERRAEAATKILLAVAADSPDLERIVKAVDELCGMYIELATSPVPEKYRAAAAGAPAAKTDNNSNNNNNNRLIPFGSRLRINRLVKSLPPNIPVLTARPRADAPRDYACVPFVGSISDGYTLAGGINVPKITRVLGTDGRRYKQLVKGKDDLRQDAIIEQLFGVINRFVAGAGRAQGRRGASELRIRTYQVVPLTKRSGVLQWVDDTVPLGNWFRAREKKYRPGAPTTSQLRAIVHDVHRDKAVTVEQKLAVFKRVCSLAPPVFRFFFYEHFYTAQSWFERREAYIRSAAVASIAGWVLGVGDRHLQNILVDQTTAEVVHIDLGIAFDLGRLLPIPELVPFRLTREMVDGMGTLGLNGTFRHTSQAALRAMRENSRVVITILNVLKVDPLYMWSLIPLRQDKINRNASAFVGDSSSATMRGALATPATDAGDGLDPLSFLDAETDAAAAHEENKEAARSIQHVGQRLGAAISVEGQVSELIQQATEPSLLSRMFEGWSAWY